MASLSQRVARLERGIVTPTAAERTASCARISAEIARLSSRFDDAEAAIPLQERLQMSAAAHFAWAQRFAPVPLAVILQLHGIGAKYGIV